MMDMKEMDGSSEMNPKMMMVKKLCMILEKMGVSPETIKAVKSEIMGDKMEEEKEVEVTVKKETSTPSEKEDMTSFFKGVNY